MPNHDQAINKIAQILDLVRVANAGRAIVDGRTKDEDVPFVLITLESVIITVLLAIFNQDEKECIHMLNEGLVPRIEERIAALTARTKKEDPHV